MAVVGLPGWIGSSAVAETGQRWMSAARTGLMLPVAGNMSEMAGRSKEINLLIYANDNYNPDTLLSQIYSYGSNGGGNSFVVTVVGDIVAYSSGVPCLNFPANLNAPYIKLIINSGVTVYGRGGDGGWITAPNTWNTSGLSLGNGATGGSAITNSIGTRLQIANYGAIAGGGGGGGCGYHIFDQGEIDNQDLRRVGTAGAGGRPYGAGGGVNRAWCLAGYGASKTAPGGGRSNVNGAAAAYGGGGGNVGSGGGGGSIGNKGLYRVTSGAGGGGAALNGSAPNWLALGAIYGARL